MQEKNGKFFTSWFYKWFMNNQAASFLLVSLLVLINLFLFTKVGYVVKPIVSFVEIILLPMILTGLLYYLLNPIVDWLEKLRLSRTVAISIVFVFIVILLVWGLAVAIPNMQEQIVSFTRNVPTYIQNIEKQVATLLQDERFEEFRPTVIEVMNQLNEQVISFAQKLSSSAVDWAGNLISTASQIIVAILIMPFILFYLLRDGKDLKGHITKFLPTAWRQPVGTVLSDMNNQLSNYVRGQVTVAAIVALMFSVLFSIIGLNYPSI